VQGAVVQRVITAAVTAIHYYTTEHAGTVDVRGRFSSLDDRSSTSGDQRAVRDRRRRRAARRVAPMRIDYRER
jgi:hypothetical protein